MQYLLEILTAFLNCNVGETITHELVDELIAHVKEKMTPMTPKEIANQMQSKSNTGAISAQLVTSNQFDVA